MRNRNLKGLPEAYYGRLIVQHLIIFTNEYTVRGDVMIKKVTVNIEYIVVA